MKTMAIPPSANSFRQPVIDGVVMANTFGIESRRVIREPSVAPPVHLTPRQLEVLALLCEGLPNKLISRRLNIAGATVKIHIAGILRALNVSSRLQAVIAARHLGLIDEPALGGAAQREPSSPPSQPIVLRILLDGVSSRWLAAASDQSLTEAVG